MATEMLPLIREEDKIRCVGCGECVRACSSGVLEIHTQEVSVGEVAVVMPVPVIVHPESCFHEGRCLVACLHKVYPCMYPQDPDEVKREAEQLIEKSRILESREKR